MRFIADTDTEENYLGINCSWRMQTELFFAVWRGAHSR